MSYDPADNSRRCYEEALKAIRLRRIRMGIYQPRPDNPEEMEAAKCAKK